VPRAGGQNLETPGTYGQEGYIYQQLAPLPNFDGYYPVLGSWIIGGEAAGLGIRESTTLVTDYRSRFVPHLFT
jgi:glutathionylspermidine synthase